MPLILCLSIAATPLHAAAALTFEDRPDGTVLETLLGLRFSIDDGGDWLYGDVRTGAYDAPYPSGALAVDGNGFAWIGQQPGVARIAFVYGTASYVAADFSTKDGLEISAYNPQNQKIATRFVAVNANTGRLTNARLVAPAGQGIAYVLISGIQNRWIMDNLETDAPQSPANTKAAQISVVQQPTPNIGAQPGSVINYEIVATNRGRGDAKNVVITMPFDPAKVQLLDAHLSRPEAWVSKLLTSTLQIETGQLRASGDVVTATLRFMVQPGVASGTQLSQLIDFRWSDAARGGVGRSNLPVLAVASAPMSYPTYPLVVERAAGTAVITITSPLFVPGEPIALWYDTPDGKTISAGAATADHDGVLLTVISTQGLMHGRYHIVAYGLWSHFTADDVTEIQEIRFTDVHNPTSAAAFSPNSSPRRI